VAPVVKRQVIARLVSQSAAPSLASLLTGVAALILAGLIILATRMAPGFRRTDQTSGPGHAGNIDDLAATLGGLAAQQLNIEGQAHPYRTFVAARLPGARDRGYDRLGNSAGRPDHPSVDPAARIADRVDGPETVARVCLSQVDTPFRAANSPTEIIRTCHAKRASTCRLRSGFGVKEARIAGVFGAKGENTAATETDCLGEQDSNHRDAVTLREYPNVRSLPV
jgi:hypothetical protein